MGKRKLKKRKKKNRNLGPRRKRMRRAARLMAAVTWRSRWSGKHIVSSYARWFGVDLLCAITELRMLGVAVAAEYEQQIRLTTAARAAENARRRARKRAAKIRRWDDVPASWSAVYDEDGTWASIALAEWIPLDEECAELASLGPAVWIPTEEEYDDLVSIAPIEWTPTEEEYEDLASIGTEWTSTPEEDSALASIASAPWIPTDEEYDGLASNEPSEWIRTGQREAVFDDLPF
jgi:hypothetical protein